MKIAYRQQLIELVRRLRFQTQADAVTSRITHELEEMEPLQQVAVELRYIAGNDYSTISAVLGKTPEESEDLAYGGLLQLRRKVFDNIKA